MSKFFKPGELVPKTGIYLSKFFETRSNFSVSGSNNFNNLTLSKAIIETMIELGNPNVSTRTKYKVLFAGSRFPNIPGISPGWELSKWWKF